MKRTLQKNILIYALSAILFLAVSSGPETMRVLAVEGRSLSGAWLMYLPSLVLNIAAVVVNDRWLIPQALLKTRFVAYILCATILSSAFSVFASFMEALLKYCFDFPNRMTDGSIRWIIDDSLANSFFLLLILVGIALIRLYDKWNLEMKEEQRMSESLREYMKDVRMCLNPDAVLSAMGEISEAIRTERDRAVEMIYGLSAFLRRQLSELPVPPLVNEFLYDKTLFSGATSFLISRRFCILRYLIFTAILGYVSYASFSYDHIGSPLDPVINALALFVFLFVVFNIIRLWFFRRYEKRHDLRSYARSVVVLLAILLSPIVILNLMSLSVPVHRDSLLLFSEILVLLGGVMGISLYVFGLSALLFFQDWIRVHRSITLLHRETLRQEYLFLRKQINPHFLFNVLNNIEISVYDDPVLASDMLADLLELLEYQLKDSNKEITAIKDEVSFLDSYLSLERSRRDHMDYEITMDSRAGDIRIPTLMFIPVVENAVKYFTPSVSHRKILVEFRIIGSLLAFECVNPYDAEIVAKKNHNAIGLENTRRRLELMYDGKARISVVKTDGIFNVKIILPLKDKRL